jgi:hypothetical protein
MVLPALMLAGLAVMLQRRDAVSDAALAGTEITLQRTGCFGTCPAYQLTIHGDGSVVYRGDMYVKTKGRATAHVGKETVRGLVRQFQRINYFSLQDKYEGGPTDGPSQITSILLGGRKKTVDHYSGSPDAPKALTSLEDAIDAAVNSQQWVQ